MALALPALCWGLDAVTLPRSGDRIPLPDERVGAVLVLDAVILARSAIGCGAVAGGCGEAGR